ncbi:hypothetical protein LHGZ1_1865 [Laribacter hongkongensis]|uniref:Uncharacterized protein n=1 Tax=Laribacter hongkongensis TaxID=168471 RepID=A0A248LK07_9NEIS|nr:hypothetical protein LHGZ1_1865 [Laribacter hongkongensis]
MTDSRLLRITGIRLSCAGLYHPRPSLTVMVVSYMLIFLFLCDTTFVNATFALESATCRNENPTVSCSVQCRTQAQSSRVTAPA